MPRRAVLPDARADAGGDVVVEADPVAEDDEERHVAVGAGEWEVDDEGVDDLVDGEDGTVDLARAHADAAAVDRGVGAAADDRGAAVGDLDPVAVAPDAGEHLEVALAVAAPVAVAPEVDRHRRHRLGDDELADLVHERLSLGAPRLDAGAERTGLQLSAGRRAGWERRRRTRCRRRCRPRWRTARRRPAPRTPRRTLPARAASPSSRLPGASRGPCPARGGARPSGSWRCRPRRPRSRSRPPARPGPRERRGRECPGCRRRARPTLPT